jgi:hypothetical protein
VKLRALVPPILAVAVILPSAARAQVPSSDPTGLIASDNVELVTSIPAPGVIGARFRDDYMYVTSVASGLIVYDVSDPASPAEVGRLALPHFENEDVDLGGDILLISNDSAESLGVLHIIDISDPTNPTRLTTYNLGSPAQSNVAWAQFFGGPGHTASCILDCKYAWVSNGAAIMVIDLTDPATPVTTGTFSTPAGGGLVTHDVQIDGNGLVWVVGFGGAAAYELPEDYSGAGLGTLITTTDPQGTSTYIETFGLGDGSNYNDFILHNSYRPEDSDVVYITEEDYTRPACEGAGSFETWDLPLKEIYDEYDPITGEGIGPPRLVPTGEPLTPLDKWVPELLEDRTAAAAMCSAHYFDMDEGIVAQGWYEMGLRFLDASDPTDIRQVGYYAPASTMMWAAYWAPTDPDDEIVYALDATHGIDVLRFDRGEGEGLPTVRAPVRDLWRYGAPGGLPSSRFGYACRIFL